MEDLFLPNEFNNYTPQNINKLIMELADFNDFSLNIHYRFMVEYNGFIIGRTIESMDLSLLNKAPQLFFSKNCKTEEINTNILFKNYIPLEEINLKEKDNKNE